jgi:surfeit locus 1 family protein
MPNISNTTSTLIIAESSERQAQPEYARLVSESARAGRVRTALFGALLLAVLLPAFISLGMWQWRKAETKVNLQHELDARSSGLLVTMPSETVDAESLRYRRVVLRGTFDPQRQVLIDNRLHLEQAGYHVITPLRLAGSTMHVLVNRGWLPADANHRVLPEAGVPSGNVELTGIAIIPEQRFFNLAAQPTTGWEPVWQNLDLERFRAVVSYPLQPLVILLDADAPGGYLREWPRPDERSERHRSYALQWFGFAVASIGIWAYFLLRRP